MPYRRAAPTRIFALTALEVMSGYSVDTLDYNLHEILFASKLTRDRESRQVLKILQNTISFDWAYVGDWREILSPSTISRRGGRLRSLRDSSRRSTRLRLGSIT